MAEVDVELLTRRALHAERTLRYLLEDVDGWRERDLMREGPANDARWSIREALNALAGEMDERLR